MKKAQKSNACSRLFINIPFFVSFLFMLLHDYCSKCNRNLCYSIGDLIESPPTTPPSSPRTHVLVHRFRKPPPLPPCHHVCRSYFPSPWFLQFFRGSFHSASRQQHICTHRIRFPWPSGTKQIFRWVYFPLPYFLQNLFSLVSLSLTASTYIYL